MMMRTMHWLRLPLLALCSVIVLAAAFGAPVQAGSANDCTSTAGRSFFIIEPWEAALAEECVPGKGIVIDNINDFVKLFFWGVDVLLKLAAYFAVGFLIWGGIKYIKANGEPGDISAAKTTVTQALVGLVISMASVALVQFVAGGL